MSYTAGNVMDLAASLLNDTAKSLYSYVTQLPYLSIAQDELESELLDNGVVIEKQIAVINVAANALFLTLPSNFFLPISLEERDQSSTDDDDWALMVERGFEDAMEPTTTLGQWNFRNNRINFIGATVAKSVRLKYHRTLSTFTNEENYVEEVTKAKMFLAFRTAALCAEFIGRRQDISQSLNAQGAISLDKLISIYTKNSQGIRVRRKPFRITRMGSR